MSKNLFPLSARSARGLAASTALALIAACGGGDPQSADASAEADVLESGPAHALVLSPTADARPRAGKLRYYGGPVLAQPKAVAVLWGNVDSDVAATLPGFYKAALGSAYFDWLSEYDTTGSAVDGSPGTGQKITRGSFAGAVQIAPKAHGKSVTDAAIQKELAAQIRKGVLPRPDDDTVFLVHFPPGLAITMGGAQSCQQGGFCGYHGAARLRGQRFAYAVLPDMGDGSGCDAGCGAGSATERVTAVASHELVEATTDPEVSFATGSSAPLAWYDETGGEIGDLCNGKTGKLRAAGHVYTVQKQWSNAHKACFLGGKAGAQDELDADGG